MTPDLGVWWVSLMQSLPKYRHVPVTQTGCPEGVTPSGGDRGRGRRLCAALRPPEAIKLLGNFNSDRAGLFPGALARPEPFPI